MAWCASAFDIAEARKKAGRTKVKRYAAEWSMGYDAWRQWPESPRARRDRQLDAAIRASFAGSRRRYGRPRVWKDLHDTGERVSENRVARLMHAAGLRARLKRFRRTTRSEHDQPVAANVLARQSSADGPNRRWWTNGVLPLSAWKSRTACPVATTMPTGEAESEVSNPARIRRGCS